MHTFSDSENRTWTFNLTIGAVKRIKALLDVDLLDPLGARARRRGGKEGRRRRTEPLITRLHRDVVLLVDVIFALIKPEADEKGITDEDFASAIGGDEGCRAREAFMAEWRDFFHRLGLQTEAKAVEDHIAMIEAEDKRTAAMIPRLTEAATAAAQRRRAKALEKIEALGACGTATGSPESSASTPKA